MRPRVRLVREFVSTLRIRSGRGKFGAEWVRVGRMRALDGRRVGADLCLCCGHLVARVMRVRSGYRGRLILKTQLRRSGSGVRAKSGIYVRGKGVSEPWRCVVEVLWERSD